MALFIRTANVLLSAGTIFVDGGCGLAGDLEFLVSRPIQPFTKYPYTQNTNPNLEKCAYDRDAPTQGIQGLIARSSNSAEKQLYVVTIEPDTVMRDYHDWQPRIINLPGEVVIFDN